MIGIEEDFKVTKNNRKFKCRSTLFFAYLKEKHSFELY